jgi:hypothetical protein
MVGMLIFIMVTVVSVGGDDLGDDGDLDEIESYELNGVRAVVVFALRAKRESQRHTYLHRFPENIRYPCKHEPFSFHDRETRISLAYPLYDRLK